MRPLQTATGLALVLLLTLMVAVPLTQGAEPPPYTRLISRNTEGVVGNGFSDDSSISSNGRFVTFQSAASDLVENDTNESIDIFLYDRTNGLMTLISSGTDGASNEDSRNPNISPDGRYIVFESAATNLVANDTNGLTDIFLYDSQNSQITRVNLGSGGVQAIGGDSNSPHVSNNADKIVYTSDATNLIANDGNVYQDIYLFTRQTVTTQRISIPNSPSTNPPNGDSFSPFISSNGQYVVYASIASNLIPNDNNDFCGEFSCGDVFLRDLNAAQTSLISKRSDGIQADNDSGIPAVSNDGRFVVFESDAENLDLVVTDTNFVTDVFLHDRTSNTTRRISVGPGNVEGFFPSTSPRISIDGNWIVFSSASDLIASDTNGYEDIYRLNRQNGTLQVVSIPEGGGETNESSREPEVSGDGQRVTFWSDATNLVQDDTNNTQDVFIRTYLEDDATVTPTSSPTNTAIATSTPTASNTPTVTRTPTPSVTGTICVGCPPTFTPTAGTVVPTFTRTPTRTGTPGPGYVPGLYLPVIQRK